MTPGGGRLIGPWGARLITEARRGRYIDACVSVYRMKASAHKMPPTDS